jgi:hypothetical protein
MENLQATWKTTYFVRGKPRIFCYLKFFFQVEEEALGAFAGKGVFHPEDYIVW